MSDPWINAWMHAFVHALVACGKHFSWCFIDAFLSLGGQAVKKPD